MVGQLHVFLTSIFVLNRLASCKYTQIGNKLYADFRGQNLTSAPDIFTNVTNIDLSNNHLTEFDLTLHYPKLNTIWLNNNKLTRIPDLRQGGTVTYCYLGGNHIAFQGEELIGLVKVYVIYWQGSGLLTFPDGNVTGQMSGLHIDRNLLTSVPKLVNFGENIMWFTLNGNKIANLNSSDLAPYRHISYLHLTDNPLLSVSDFCMWDGRSGLHEGFKMELDFRYMNCDCSLAWTKFWRYGTVKGLCPNGRKLAEMNLSDLGCLGK